MNKKMKKNKKIVKDYRDWTIEDMVENVLTGRKPKIEVEEKEKQRE